MAIRTVLKMGDARLLRHAQPVEDFGSDALQELARDLLDTMHATGGVGIAAPQIGVDLRLIVFEVQGGSARYPDAPEVPRTFLCNPHYTPLASDQDEDWEGCLSVPGLRGMVPRYRSIRYHGQDLNGGPVHADATGFHARVVQHETDHLNGVLYPARIRDFSRFGFTDVLFPDQNIV